MVVRYVMVLIMGGTQAGIERLRQCVAGATSRDRVREADCAR